VDWQKKNIRKQASYSFYYRYAFVRSNPNNTGDFQRKEMLKILKLSAASQLVKLVTRCLKVSVGSNGM